MYSVGDKVLYPTHGAGVIDSIEEKTLLGEKKSYYTMRMPVGDMKVMVPLESADAAGLRRVVSKSEAENVIKKLATDEPCENSSWNRRFRENSEKIRSGNIYLVASVVRSLTIRERERGLSTGEKKMLSDSRQILISELVLSLDKTKEEVSEMSEKSIFG